MAAMAAVMAGALLAGGGPAAGGAGEGGDALAVLDGVVTFHAPRGAGAVGPTGSVRLRGALLDSIDFTGFDPRVEDAAAALGASVCRAGPGAGVEEPEAVTRVRRTPGGDWVVRTVKAFGGRGRWTLRLNPVAGRFTWRARGLPAGDLAAAGPDGVAVSLALAGTEWSESVDFREDRPGRRWSYVRPPAVRPLPGGGGGGGVGGGGGGTPPPPASTGFTTIARGTSSGITSYTFRVAVDQASWNTLWAQHAGGGTAPAVDFSKEMVVGVWLGNRATGGFSVTITSAQVTQILGMPNVGPGVFVQAREDVPGANCFVTQALTQPFHVIRMPRAVDGSMISLTQNVVNCP